MRRSLLSAGTVFTLSLLTVSSQLVMGARLTGEGRTVAQAAVSTAAGSYTRAQAAEGRRTYQAECSECHLDDMTGGDQAPPLAGQSFSENWEGMTAGELAVRIRDTMPPARDEPLELARVLELVAYLLQANRFGPGDRPLTESVMEEIAIEH